MPSFRSVQVPQRFFAALIIVTSLGMVSLGTPAQAQCTLNAANPSVTICSPANGATTTSPVQITAGTTDSSSITLMQVYVDGIKAFEAHGSTLNSMLKMTVGTRRVTVQAYDAANRIFKSTINITVSSAGPPPQPPPPSPPPSPGQGLGNIQHIIFMLQENRSADNYFGVFNQYRASHGINDNAFDGMDLNKAMPSRSGAFMVTPYHYKTVCTDNLSPAWNESHYDIHNGAMDYFMKTTGSVPSSIDPEGTRAVGYYDWTDLPYYYDLAFKFGTSDRYFSAVLATTIPNRMYMFTGTSFGYIRPVGPPAGGWTQPTIFDRLTAKGISWRYYYQDNSTFLAQFATWGKGGSGHVYNISSYYTDVASNSLPQVIFIERGGQTGLDEHPLNNVQKGAADVKKIIDALMNGPNWSSSVFILTFDEGGGLYDHVLPPKAVLPDNIAPIYKAGDNQSTFNQYGFRVPLIVVSPWSKPNLVSHTVRDHTSILKLIEVRFGLQPLTQRDTDADDMEEFFDFSAPHYPQAPNMDLQPTSGVCDRNQEKAPGH